MNNPGPVSFKPTPQWFTVQLAPDAVSGRPQDLVWSAIHGKVGRNSARLSRGAVFVIPLQCRDGEQAIREAKTIHGAAKLKALIAPKKAKP